MTDATNLTRPTQVSKQTYILFVTRCRSEGHNIRHTLNKLLEEYNKKGEKIFI